MLECRLRYATIEDVEAFYLAFRSVVEPLELYNEWARKDELAKYAPKNLVVDLGANPRGLLLAYVENEIAGFSITEVDDGLIWINWFGVVAEFRGNGIGHLLISRLLDDARADGFWKIWCDTRVGNIYSIPLLQRNGFVERCRFQRHWYGQDFIIWERFLD